MRLCGGWCRGWGRRECWLGASFCVSNPDLSTLRLSFATVDVGKIEEDVGRLGRALKTVTAGTDEVSVTTRRTILLLSFATSARHPRQPVFAGFSFFMFHNTMQANARRRHRARSAQHGRVAVFIVPVFGQSLGVVTAASLIDRIGSGAVISLGGHDGGRGGFAWALRRRDGAASAT